MTVKNILLVFTGGTIGSQIDNGTIDTSEQAGFKLIEMFRQQVTWQQDIHFETLQPLSILSENLHPDAWLQLIVAIEAQDLSRFDGIIVTHGTDTLAFSAAMQGIYFHALPIPLLLVSSNLPLENPLANGLPNLICAVEYIRRGMPAETWVPYCNPGQAMHVHRATRLSSCLPLSSDFLSIQSQPGLSFDGNDFLYLDTNTPELAEHWPLQAKFGRILLIRPYPGLDYAAFNLDGFDAVLHDLYHSGTACVSRQWGTRHSLIDFSLRCRQAKMPLYLAPAIHTHDAYSSTREMLQHGTKMVWNTSLESVYAKLLLAYGNSFDEETVSGFLTANIAGESIQPSQPIPSESFGLRRASPSCDR